jgi:hypothetical protein
VNRANQILIGLFAVQIVLAIVTLSADNGAPPAKLEAIAPDLDATKVTRVQIFDARARDAATPEAAAVDLQKSGPGWVLANKFQYPVDAAKVTILLTDLASMKARGPMATSKARHAQLGVADDDYQRKVIVTTDAGDRTFFIGGSAGGRLTAVRKGGEDKVYAVGGISSYSVDATPRGWVDDQYFTVTKDDIVGLEVKTDHGDLALDRSLGPWMLTENGAPSPLAAGEVIDGTKVDALLAKLQTLTLSEPADPARDASHPTATITLRMKGAAAPATDAGPAVSEPGPERVLDVIVDADKDWVHERNNPRAALVDPSLLQQVIELSKAAVVGSATAPAPTAPPEPEPEPGFPPGLPPQ